jgi:hypothetical protein
MKYEYGRSLLPALREHYSDICSDGDVEVHRILDALESGADVGAENDEHVHITCTLLHWRSLGYCQPDVGHAL